MKILAVLMLMLLCCSRLSAQSYPDSVKKYTDIWSYYQWKKHTNDTALINYLHIMQSYQRKIDSLQDIQTVISDEKRKVFLEKLYHIKLP